MKRWQRFTRRQSYLHEHRLDKKRDKNPSEALPIEPHIQICLVPVTDTSSSSSVWAAKNIFSSEITIFFVGKPRVLQFMGSQTAGHDLDWTTTTACDCPVLSTTSDFTSSRSLLSAPVSLPLVLVGTELFPLQAKGLINLLILLTIWRFTREKSHGLYHLTAAPHLWLLSLASSLDLPSFLSCRAFSELIVPHSQGIFHKEKHCIILSIAVQWFTPEVIGWRQ